MTGRDDRDRDRRHLGRDRAENADAPSREGWPNELDDSGRPRRTTALEPGKLNSPHTLAVDRQGNIYITEWLIGGRIIKLKKLPS